MIQIMFYFDIISNLTDNALPISLESIDLPFFPLRFQWNWNLPGCFHRAPHPLLVENHLRSGKALVFCHGVGVGPSMFLGFQPTWRSTINPPNPPTKSSWRVLMDGHFWHWNVVGLLLAHPPRCLEWFFFGTILFEGASHFYSSWPELWGRRHLFGSIWWTQLSVAVRLLCSGAGASHLPSGYSGNLHEVFRWCPWCQRGTATESWAASVTSSCIIQDCILES